MSAGCAKKKRRGDPRMNRALDAREADPEMSLVDALLAGGFIFPDLDTNMAAKNVYDTDGVTLFQRKNQLLRRLRVGKHKDSKSSVLSSRKRTSDALDEEEKDAKLIALTEVALDRMTFKEMIFPEDERRELESISGKERAEIISDIKGAKENSAICATYTDNELNDFDAALDEVDIAKKCALVRAQMICPDLVSKKQKMMFLRWADFDVKQATARFVIYWGMREQLFGDDAFLPLTLDRIRESDRITFQAQICIILPQKDDHGRAIMWGDPSRRYPAIHTAESEARCMWYRIHHALEDESVQVKGFVFVAFAQNTGATHFDRSNHKMCFNTFNEWLPMKVMALHIVRPFPFISLFLPIVKFFMGRKLRHRLLQHNGTNKEILEALSTYGMSESVLPTDIGGQIDLSELSQL